MGEIRDKDSFGYLFSGMFGAIFNIVMNFMLIPLIGVYGAAIATCMENVLLFQQLWTII